MGNYYKSKYNVDFRSIRYPGVIAPYEYESHGTTDYASEIFFAALKKKIYTNCLSPNTVLPMAYLDDVIDGTIKFLETDIKNLTVPTYNMQGLSFSCEEIVTELKKHFPDFDHRYEPDFRDKIAKSWPEELDDNLARKDWGWDPLCMDVKSLIEEVLKHIKKSKMSMI